eukprot:s3986_g10.t1
MVRASQQAAGFWLHETYQVTSGFAKSNSSTNVAAGSGAQGASVINTSKVGNPDTSAAAAAPDEGEAVEPKRTGSSSSKAIVAAEDPAGNGWAYEDVWSYVDSMGVTKIPGEEHILRFLADCLHASPLPAPWDTALQPWRGQLGRTSDEAGAL